ncbi:hypothetical protein [Streptomyces sp. NPDC046939]|uniref:hypothetical protein n=1 Tax=Streptomyces sp. NPDC046939 TaxID=3155376 RepID=UPI0033DEDF0C
MDDTAPDSTTPARPTGPGAARVLIAVVWRPARGRAYAHRVTSAHWKNLLPDADLIDIDTDDKPFNIAACRNAGVRHAQKVGADVVILSDADALTEAEPVAAAIAEAATSGRVHLPYSELRALGPRGSKQFLAGVPLPACDAVTVDGAVGTVYVTAPATWLSLGGQDTRFRGWGFEDPSFHLAHHTLKGAPLARHPGRVYTLHHPPAKKKGPHYDANLALCGRYHQAAGNPTAMRALLAERQAAGQFRP